MSYKISSFRPVYAMGGIEPTQERVETLRVNLLEKIPALEATYEEKSKKYMIAQKIENQKSKELEKTKAALLVAESKEEKRELKQKINTQRQDFKEQKQITKLALENKKTTKRNLEKTKTAARRPSRLEDMLRTGRLDPTEY